MRASINWKGINTNFDRPAISTSCTTWVGSMVLAGVGFGQESRKYSIAVVVHVWLCEGHQRPNAPSVIIFTYECGQTGRVGGFVAFQVHTRMFYGRRVWT